MPKVGTYGLDMMYRTCTVQANLDFSSEADMVKKLRVSLALQPVATALFANSPFTEGKPNGFLSFRSQIWTRHRQPARRHAAFRVRGRHGLRALCRLRARRADVFRQARRQIYRRLRQVVPRFLRRQARRIAGRAADDFRLGQSPVDDFPRGAAQALSRNARRRRRAVAAAAVAHGLLGRACSTTTMRSMPAGTWSKDWSAAERQKLRDDVPRLGFQGGDRQPQRADAGAGDAAALRARACARRKSSTATAATRRAICGRWRRSIARGITPAEELLRKYFNEWNGSVEPIFDEYAYLGRSRSREAASIGQSHARDAGAGKGRRRLHAARIRLRPERRTHRHAGGAKRSASSRRGC